MVLKLRFIKTQTDTRFVFKQQALKHLRQTGHTQTDTRFVFKLEKAVKKGRIGVSQTDTRFVFKLQTKQA